MKKYLKIILMVIILVIITSAFVYYQKTKSVLINDNSSIPAKETIVGTYIGHLAKDVYTLTILSEKDESFTGTLDINNFEKDSSTGTLKGTYKNGILLADYTFQSEGSESVGWVIFKKVADGFVRGFGNVSPETKTQSINLNQITFDYSVIYKFSNTIVQQ